jgi:hypothetical protein
MMTRQHDEISGLFVMRLQGTAGAGRESCVFEVGRLQSENMKGSYSEQAGEWLVER